jgi:hypothetical protein
MTQFARAMKQLNVEPILANRRQQPQAKGRVQRMNGTLQDRLVKEMRLWRAFATLPPPTSMMNATNANSWRKQRP